MPTSTRPTSALFWQIVKGAVVDTSLKRLTNSDAGRNLPLVFAYFTRLSFESLLLSQLECGKTGKDILMEDPKGVTIETYLKCAEFKNNRYTQTVVKRIFDSFVRDGALEAKTSNGERRYRYVGEIPPLDKEEMDAVLETNRYLIYAGEDIIPNITKSLKEGAAVIDKGDREYSLVVEAMFQDYLFQASRKEATFYILKDSYKFLNPDEIKILSLYGGAGHSLVHFTEYLLQTYRNKTIKIFGCDTSFINIARTRINLRSLQIDFRTLNRESAIDIVEKFILIENLEDWYIKFGNLMDTIDILLVPHVFNNLNEEKASRFFKRLSEMIHKDGVIVIFQPTSHSDDFPLPLYPVFANFKGFYDLPTKNFIRTLASRHFGYVKAYQLESLWILKKPKR